MSLLLHYKLPFKFRPTSTIFRQEFLGFLNYAPIWLSINNQGGAVSNTELVQAREMLLARQSLVCQSLVSVAVASVAGMSVAGVLVASVAGVSVAGVSVASVASVAGVLVASVAGVSVTVASVAGVLVASNHQLTSLIMLLYLCVQSDWLMLNGWVQWCVYHSVTARHQQQIPTVRRTDLDALSWWRQWRCTPH